ncbi:MAG: hypothetical protein HPM95_10135 [Alphaproteobacteria bacterium]|nr:hypothetical protein [Alphaproteobacteria bacterium]
MPNYPASHGCIRLPRGFAKDLFGKTERGGHVIVTRERTRPEGILHAALPRSGAGGPRSASLDPDTVLLRPALPGAAGDAPETVGSIDRTADTAKAEPRDPLRILITRTSARERLRDMQRVLDELDMRLGRSTGDGPQDPRRDRALPGGRRAACDRRAERSGPAGALCRGRRDRPATGRLYVRRKFKEIYSANVC